MLKNTKSFKKTLSKENHAVLDYTSSMIDYLSMSPVKDLEYTKFSMIKRKHSTTNLLNREVFLVNFKVFRTHYTKFIFPCRRF